jgi:hypothetical protein
VAIAQVRDTVPAGEVDGCQAIAVTCHRCVRQTPKNRRNLGGTCEPERAIGYRLELRRLSQRRDYGQIFKIRVPNNTAKYNRYVITDPTRFQDHRHRPVGHPSRLRKGTTDPACFGGQARLRKRTTPACFGGQARVHKRTTPAGFCAQARFRSLRRQPAEKNRHGGHEMQSLEAAPRLFRPDYAPIRARIL